MPDIYQGTELWDFSLVDPDNRRPVDYPHRQQLFDDLQRWGSAPDALSVGRLLETPEDGRLKLYLIWRTLCFRREHPDLFQQGEYQPLAVSGAKSNHVVAFERKYQDLTAVVIAPRLVAGLINDVGVATTENSADTDGIDTLPLESQIWGDTHVLLPCKCREKYRNVLTGEALEAEGEVGAAQAFANFPVALFVKE